MQPEVEITPEPTPQERAAILAALAALLAPATESAWFRAGIEEAHEPWDPSTACGDAW